MIASWICPWCGEESHQGGDPCPSAVSQINGIRKMAGLAPRAPETIKAAGVGCKPEPSKDGLSGASGAGGNQKSRLYECFWPRCSNHRRCAEFGSCVAIAQRNEMDAIAMRRPGGVTYVRRSGRFGWYFLVAFLTTCVWWFLRALLGF